MKCKNETRNLRFGVFEDCHVVDESTICIKPLTSDIDVYALRYAAEKLARSNGIYIADFNSRNAFQDNRLYLNDFMGLEIDNFVVRTLFLTDDNKFCADCEEDEQMFVLLVG